MTETLQQQVHTLGRQLLDAARGERRWWSRLNLDDALLGRMMNDDRLRTASLRFVDVLPALSDDDESLARHLDEYLHGIDLPVPMPGVANWGLRKARSGVAAHALAATVRAMVHRMAKRFIGGHDADSAAKCLKRLHKLGMGFTLDLLGEACVSEAEAEAYQKHYLSLLDELAVRVALWPANVRLETISDRPAPRLNLSIKVSSLCSQITAVDPAGSIDAVAQRLRPILQGARQLRAFICLDMEQYDAKAVTLGVFKKLLMEPAFRDWPDVGIAVQAYLRETLDDLRGLIDWAKQRGTPVTIRLVRGAYWDYETVIARQHGWPVPVWTNKPATDLHYEAALALLFDNYPHVETAVGTHNVRSIALALALARQVGLRPDQFEFQMLYGMADELKRNLVEMRQRLRVYVPFGELIPGMAYLVRRLLENTASQSFLRMGLVEDVPADELLAAPVPPIDTHPDDDSPSPSRAAHHAGETELFRNEPLRRFTADAEREAFSRALRTVASQLGRHYPLVIGAHEVDGEPVVRSINPADPSQLVGTTPAATPAHVSEAIDAASDALEPWRNLSADRRARYLLDAAAVMRFRRDELAAWQVYEAGKPWREADADVVEAIDFLEYYARGAMRLGRGVQLHVPGEHNDYLYEPRGVGAVIAPWNFPLAILTGMTAAAIAVGNTVVIKPAPQTPVVAAKLIDVLRQAKLPPGVVNYLPGGDEVGKALVADPRVHFIAFTGSQKVGLAINRVVADVPAGQHHVKHVIAEMGGKNTIIIDDDADVDDAVLGVARSAFGFAGQKCSACSRAVIVGRLYEPFIRRLVEAAASLRVGPPADPGTFLGPVIDHEAFTRINQTIHDAAKHTPLALRVDTSHLGDGYYSGPTIFRDVNPDSDLAQQEIFGPVLAVMRADCFDHALCLAQNTPYALTGGLYSRSPAHLDVARRHFRVGNLYLNRPITGAVVNRQPFGGLKLSGLGTRAGGPDYLLAFTEPRTVTENTLRRGFAPEQ